MMTSCDVDNNGVGGSFFLHDPIKTARVELWKNCRRAAMFEVNCSTHMPAIFRLLIINRLLHLRMVGIQSQGLLWLLVVGD